ncbi:hypothetical protein CKJ70_08120 [Mycobacterium avium]|nr:hypothetical protein CKJ70_08120 [Mycobacterium avium]
MIGPTDFQIILGKVRPLSRPHPEAHPQVLIIAHPGTRPRTGASLQRGADTSLFRPSVSVAPRTSGCAGPR